MFCFGKIQFKIYLFITIVILHYWLRFCFLGNLIKAYAIVKGKMFQVKVIEKQ